jgi:hypothetical protein
MKLYILMFFVCIYSYQMQPADASLSSDRAAVLKAKLDSVKKSDSEYFQALVIFNEPAKFPIKPAHERVLCQRLFDADRKMHYDTLIFIRHVSKISNPEIVDCRLLIPKAIAHYIRKLQERPLTPQSSKEVVEFFEVKKPWLNLQEAYKQAIAARKDLEFSDEEK